MAGTLSISLQCIYSLPTQDTSTCPQCLFARGGAEDTEDTFNDVFKEDLVTLAGMRGRRLMRRMRIDPYPDALIRRGFYRNKPRETAHPILESVMMYTSAVGMEVMEGLAIVQDAVDRSTLETSERKMEVDGALVRLRHQLGRRDERVAVIDTGGRGG